MLSSMAERSSFLVALTILLLTALYFIVIGHDGTQMHNGHTVSKIPNFEDAKELRQNFWTALSVAKILKTHEII